MKSVVRIREDSLVITRYIVAKAMGCLPACGDEYHFGVVKNRTLHYSAYHGAGLNTIC
jgi:hypothetical protein